MLQCKFLIVLCAINYCAGSVVYRDPKLYEGSNCTLTNGSRGICSENCSTSLHTRGLTNLCGFNKRTPIICCPMGSASSQPSYPILKRVCEDRRKKQEERIQTMEDIKRRRLIEQEELKKFYSAYYALPPAREEEVLRICRNEAEAIGNDEGSYYLEKCDSLVPAHGIVGPPAIHPASPGEYPHMAALGWQNENGVVTWFCGGTLIHPEFVLTGAHCITNTNNQPNIVRVADVDLNSLADNEFTSDYDVQHIYVHHAYQSSSYYNDIALIGVSRKPEFRRTLLPLPACLWTEQELPSNNLLMMGYGAPAFGQSHLQKLYIGNLTVMPNEECSDHYKLVETLPKNIVESQLCAHDPSGILDTCEGDSGGPLQFNDNDTLRTPYLVGITSFGILCLDGNPGVYTRVHSYLDWIEDTINGVNLL